MMYCTNCGSYIRDDHHFCTNCGSLRPEDRNAPKGTRLVPILITTIMFLFGLGVYVFSNLGSSFLKLFLG